VFWAKSCCPSPEEPDEKAAEMLKSWVTPPFVLNTYPSSVSLYTTFYQGGRMFFYEENRSMSSRNCLKIRQKHILSVKSVDLMLVYNFLSFKPSSKWTIVQTEKNVQPGHPAFDTQWYKPSSQQNVFVLLSFQTRDSVIPIVAIFWQRTEIKKLVSWQRLNLDQRAILNFSPGPQGETSPLGVNLAPRGEICPLGGMFTPLFTLRC
jgi:hypothetical protein